MIKVSDAELEVMKILWNGNQTANYIVEKLQEIFSWNESTIRTLIGRLQLKGAIKIIQKNGRIYTYSSCINENEYKLVESSNFIKKIYNGSINNMLINFVKNKDLTKKELQELIDLIDKEEK